MCSFSYLRTSSANVLFSFNNNWSKMKDVRIVVEIYIYLLLEYRNDKMNKETNCSRECYGIHTRHQPRTRRVNIRMSVVFSFTYVCICTRVRVISQMIAFCARPRKYAKLRQRLPPFSTIFNARGKSRIESKYWKKKKKCLEFDPFTRHAWWNTTMRK